MAKIEEMFLGFSHNLILVGEEYSNSLLRKVCSDYCVFMAVKGFSREKELKSLTEKTMEMPA